MSSTQSILNTDRLNYLNIGLMILSLGVAYFVPFELFLFSYAVLGPAHYLTEISWLHERKYFSNGKRDFILLGIAGVILFLLVYAPDLHLQFFEDPRMNARVETYTVAGAFVASLCMVLLKNPLHRFVSFMIICILIIIGSGSELSKPMILFFSVFLPTLIHVYFFTMLFMLYGALKGRSKSGFLSVLILIICPIIIFSFVPELSFLSDYAKLHYQKFQMVNAYTLSLHDSNSYIISPHSQEDLVSNFRAIYQSRAGVAIMRFIAFAYTYHYLNWFSKTTIIKWHNVPKQRLIIIGGLWITAVFFYWYKYEIGFNILFLLSFLHVFLEFPLNHVTIIGIYKETRSIFSGKPVETVPVKKGTVKKK